MTHTQIRRAWNSQEIKTIIDHEELSINQLVNANKNMNATEESIQETLAYVLN